MLLAKFKLILFCDEVTKGKRSNLCISTASNYSTLCGSPPLFGIFTCYFVVIIIKLRQKCLGVVFSQPPGGGCSILSSRGKKYTSVHARTQRGAPVQRVQKAGQWGPVCKKAYMYTGAEQLPRGNMDGARHRAARLFYSLALLKSIVVMIFLHGESTA